MTPRDKPSGKAMRGIIVFLCIYNLILSYLWMEGSVLASVLLVVAFAGGGSLAWKVRTSGFHASGLKLWRPWPWSPRWNLASLAARAARLKRKLPPGTIRIVIVVVSVLDFVLSYAWTRGNLWKSALLVLAAGGVGLLLWYGVQSVSRIRRILLGEIKEGEGGWRRDAGAVAIFGGAAVLYAILSPLWVDQDGLGPIGWSIKGASSIFAVYKEWDWGPSFYAPGPVNSWLLLIGHPLFKFLGYTFPQSVAEGWGFNPFTLYLYKWIQGVPFVLGAGFVFYKLFGRVAAALFLFNPATLWFIVLGGLFDNMYAVFFVTLALYFLHKERPVLFVLAIAFAMLSKQTVMLLLPVVIVMLLFSKGARAIPYLALLFGVAFAITYPYKLYDPAAYIAHDDFWLRPSMHYGFGWAVYFFSTPAFMAFWMALLVVKRPKFNLVNFSLWTTPLYMVYTIAAGFFFEKMIYTALPMMLVVTMALFQDRRKEIVWLFLALTLLPCLTQVWWRTRMPEIRMEPYTNYWNVHTPIRLKLDLREEINQVGLLVSAELGIMLAFIVYGSARLFGNRGDEWRWSVGGGFIGKEVSLLCIAVFLMGALYTYYRSSDWTRWKEFALEDVIRNADLEVWPAAASGGPESWTIDGKEAAVDQVQNRNSGGTKYYAKLLSGRDESASLVQEIPIENYCGGVVQATASLWAERPGGAYVILSDGMMRAAAFHSGGGKFEDVSVGFKVENTGLLAGRRKLKVMLVTGRGNTALFGNVRLKLVTRQRLFPVQTDDVISFASAF
ncbi:MAG: hypothetical protein HYX74_01400 [Acidobacteria bacterium]|nr:hypothetical protein [Acidobacteriota bacterium]